MKPPLATRRPVRDSRHGETRVDDYAWLRERDGPGVRAYLEAENAYTEETLAPLAPFRETLYREMLARIQETDMSVPYREGEYLLYSRTEEGRQYPILCRRRVEGGDEEVVLDLNALASGHPFLSLGVYAFNDDGTRLAYSLDVTGFREYTLHVKDMGTEAALLEPVPQTGSVAWAADGETLFYTVDDPAKRPYQVYRRRLDRPSPVLVLEERDEHFRLSVGRTRSRALVIALSASHTTTEASFLRADEPEAAWRLVAPREAEHEYDVDHCGDRLFIRTNRGGRNFHLVTAPLTDPGPSSWTELVPHRSDVMVEGVELFAHHAVLLEREHGLPHFAIRDLRSGETHRVAFPEATYSAAPSANAEMDTAVFRFSYQSLVTPSSIFDYDMERRESTLLKQQPVLGGYDKSQYVSERREAVAADGARIPISLVYRKGTRDAGAAPMLLSGYGAYGYPYPVTFSSTRLSLLDRGVAYAIAHVRGGSELGKAWHDQGRLFAKKNTFTDFIAVAERLIADGDTAADRLVIEGGSAGGLLIGAVVNARPELFRAALLRVPFLDVLNTMLDASLPLTVGEYEEWGNPEKPEEYVYIRGYCPYTNLAAQAYPAMLVKTSFHDSQVMYWEPAKYVARLRTLKTDDRPLLLHTNMAAGHGGASGRYDALRETAFDYAFVLGEVGRAG
jgi:oligopeptidase B